MTRQPNIILINCDDLGYGDLGCYGSTRNRTPHLDRMADEGTRFTDLYMASPVCSPSRGAMLTGCYPNRIGFDQFDGQAVLFPGQACGLNPSERTIARELKDLGYATKIVGKWHCRDQPEFLPSRHGFDEYFGLPYSNDMGRQACDRSAFVSRMQEQCGVDYTAPGKERIEDWPPLPLLNDEQVCEAQPDQTTLTERYVAAAVDFIERKKDQPFFLYFAHMYVHLPIYVPEPWLSNSHNGPYGAAVEHVDWSVGQLLDALRQRGLDENTVVIFTSDNGSRARGEGGSNDPLRGHKGQCYEGGQRLPCIVRWPGVVPAGRSSDALTAAIDFLPTLLRLAGGQPASDRIIDGKDCADLWIGKREDSPRDTFLYLHRGSVHAIRQGPWKLHVLRVKADFTSEPVHELYHLGDDLAEEHNILDQEPEVVTRLTALIEAARQELGDAYHGMEGKAVRPIGRVADNDSLTHHHDHHPVIIAEYDLHEAG